MPISKLRGVGHTPSLVAVAAIAAGGAFVITRRTFIATPHPSLAPVAVPA